MRNIKDQLSKDKKRHKILQIQKMLYSYASIPEENIRFDDLFINDTEFIHYTEINIVPRAEDNTLILIHGYGGSNNSYYRMIKHLSNHFHIITIDLPGMALSSRVKVKHHFNDTKTCIKFFIDRFQAFFNKLKLERIHLVGHSIGSYISTHYFDKYPDRVIKLYMLSPAGFNYADEESTKKIEAMLEDMSYFKRKIINYMRNKIYKEKKSAFEAFWVPCKSYFIKKYFSAQRFSFSPEEVELLVDYHAYIFSLPQSGERCLGYLLDNGIKSQMPLIEVLDKNKRLSSKIIILYGEYDWMDKEEAIRNMEERELFIRVEKVSRSDHQIINQNAEEVSEIIVEFARKEISELQF